jgi:transcription termination/antitermination protein NusG
VKYFVLQVTTGEEDKFVRLARTYINADAERLFWPRRKLRIRKKGKQKDKDIPLFPGYVFLETEELDPDTYWKIRRINGFFQFLPSNRRIEPLAGKDEELIRHFLSYGEVLDKSMVYFDENNRIRVVRGALKGLEGNVVKVDRRKRRAKVKLMLYDNSFLVDFGFELLEPADSTEKPA